MTSETDQVRPPPGPLTTPPEPFVDPLPQRLIAAEHRGRLTVRIRDGEHRFHRDLPTSAIWTSTAPFPGRRSRWSAPTTSPLSG